MDQEKRIENLVMTCCMVTIAAIFVASVAVIHFLG